MFRPVMQPIDQSNTILISGAGIAGLLLARQLDQFGIPYLLIESRASLTTDGAGIALPANAMKALRHLHLAAAVEQCAHQVREIIYTDTAGNVLNQASLLEAPLNADKFVALHRSELHHILSDGLLKRIHFNTKITSMQQTDDGVFVEFNNKKLKPQTFAGVIGADGVHSVVRELTFNHDALVDVGLNIWRWTCQYPTKNLEPTYMLGAAHLFMVYPISDNEVYCYLHAAGSEAIQNHREFVINKLQSFGGMAKNMLAILPDAEAIIPGRLRSVAKPLFSLGRVALVGDAGHACSPMLQQGAAAALEDIITVAQLLRFFPVEEAFARYEALRKERVHWVSQASDGPIKMLIGMKEEQLGPLYEKIRKEGPLNVNGWKALLAKDPLAALEAYLKETVGEGLTPTALASKPLAAGRRFCSG